MDDDVTEVVIFLHGLGAGPESWDAQIPALPSGFSGLAPRIAGLADGDAAFSVSCAVAALVEDLDRRGAVRAHLCGLSLGAIVATQVAIDHPDRVATLVLSAGQARPHPVLMTVQGAIMRLVPAAVFARAGLSKRTMLGVLRALATLDLRPGLGRITAPTLVLCGAKDWPNLPAARALAAGIPGAQLQIVPRAGHEWNKQLPEEFSSRLNGFLVGA